MITSIVRVNWRLAAFIGNTIRSEIISEKPLQTKMVFDKDKKMSLDINYNLEEKNRIKIYSDMNYIGNIIVNDRINIWNDTIKVYNTGAKKIFFYLNDVVIAAACWDEDRVFIFIENNIYINIIRLYISFVLLSELGCPEKRFNKKYADKYNEEFIKNIIKNDDTYIKNELPSIIWLS